MKKFFLLLIVLLGSSLYAQYGNNLETGIQYYNEARFEEAIKKLEYYTSSSDNDKAYQANFYIGLCYKALNDISNAKNYFKKAINNNPDKTVSRYSYPPDIVELYNRARSELPYIENVRFKDMYPYKSSYNTNYIEVAFFDRHNIKSLRLDIYNDNYSKSKVHSLDSQRSIEQWNGMVNNSPLSSGIAPQLKTTLGTLPILS